MSVINNMAKIELTNEQYLHLKKLHKTLRDKALADKIKAIVMLSRGLTYEEIEEHLLIDERTIRRYEDKFLKEGEEVLLKVNYVGKKPKLSKQQLDKLASFMESHLFSTSKEIVNYVFKEFGVTYTCNGIVPLLHKIGFSYKKTKLVPGKANKDKQEEFVKVYNELRSNLKPDEKLYFMDSTHPTHNTMPAYAWIKTGTDKEIKSNTGRKKVNICGAYSPIDKEIIALDEEWVNSDSIIRLYKEIEVRHPELSMIYVIGDNARYNYSKKVRKYLEISKIKFIPLPTYSPNLNLIERLWLFLKKNVLYNKYYETFQDFKDKIFDFLNNGIKEKQEELETLMAENFHIMSG